MVDGDDSLGTELSVSGFSLDVMARPRYLVLDDGQGCARNLTEVGAEDNRRLSHSPESKVSAFFRGSQLSVADFLSPELASRPAWRGTTKDLPSCRGH